MFYKKNISSIKFSKKVVSVLFLIVVTNILVLKKYYVFYDSSYNETFSKVTDLHQYTYEDSNTNKIKLFCIILTKKASINIKVCMTIFLTLLHRDDLAQMIQNLLKIKLHNLPIYRFFTLTLYMAMYVYARFPNERIDGPT